MYDLVKQDGGDMNKRERISLAEVSRTTGKVLNRADSEHLNEGAPPTLEDITQSLHFSPGDGRIWLNGQRMQLLHMSSLGSLRRELIEMHRYPTSENKLDEKRWGEFETLRNDLIKDDERRDSLVTQLLGLFEKRQYPKASEFLIALRKRVAQARENYRLYVGNIL